MYRLAFHLPDIKKGLVLQYSKTPKKSSNFLKKIGPVLERFLLPMVDALCGKPISISHPNTGIICIRRKKEFVANLLRSIKRVLVPDVSVFGGDEVAKLDREKAFGIISLPSASTE